MSNIIEGLVENVEVRGPFAGKDGKPDFEVHELTINGLKLQQFMEAQSNPSANVGDNVKVLFTANSKGKFTNNTITKLSKLESLVSNTKTSTTDEAPFSDAKPIHKTTSGRFDNRGARVGGVLHDAVAIALHTNKNATDTTQVLAAVEKIAKNLLNIATKLEK